MRGSKIRHDILQDGFLLTNKFGIFAHNSVPSFAIVTETDLRLFTSKAGGRVLQNSHQAFTDWRRNNSLKGGLILSSFAVHDVEHGDYFIRVLHHQVTSTAQGLYLKPFLRNRLLWTWAEDIGMPQNMSFSGDPYADTGRTDRQVNPNGSGPVATWLSNADHDHHPLNLPWSPSNPQQAWHFWCEHKPVLQGMWKLGGK